MQEDQENARGGNPSRNGERLGQNAASEHYSYFTSIVGEIVCAYLRESFEPDGHLFKRIVAAMTAQTTPTSKYRQAEQKEMVVQILDEIRREVEARLQSSPAVTTLDRSVYS